MKFTIIPIIVSLLAGIGDHGCRAGGGSDHMLFKLDDLTYQAWSVSETLRGTDVIINLVDVEPGVEFISITYRGMEVPVSTEESGEKTVLKASFITGESLLDNYEYRVTDEDDNLKYKYMSQEYKFLVKNIRRLPTRIKQ